MPQLDTTEARTILDRPFLRIVHYPANDLIKLTWHGYTPSAEYRDGLETAREYITDYGVTRWLADLRQMGAILQADEKWTNTTWWQGVARSDLKKMAVMRSDDYFNDMSVERIMNTAMDLVDFEVAYFRSEEEALAWLLA